MFLSRSTATTTTGTVTLTTNTHTETATTTTTDTETATTTTTHTQTTTTVTETETSTTTTTLAEAATITGSINLNVSNRSAFIIDPQVKAALVASVAATAGVEEGSVTVTRRALVTGVDHVELGYKIVLPPDEPAATLAESKRIKAAFGTTREQVEQKLGAMTATITKRVDEAVGNGLFTVDVTDMSIPEVQIEVEQAKPSPAPADEESKLWPIIIVVIALAFVVVGALVIAFLCCRRPR